MAKTIAALVLLLLSAFASPYAASAVTTYYIVLQGAQEFPTNASSATGSGTVTLDDVALTLSYNITFSGLSAAETGAHFHGPAVRGVNAGVLIGLALGSPKTGSTSVTASQATDILAGKWYVNVHSTAFPGGEIRGQLDNVGPYDTTPDAFTFTDQSMVAPSTLIVSNPVAINGTNGPAPIMVSGGEYSIACTETFVSSSGMIGPGATVCVRHTSSAASGGMMMTMLNVGGVMDTFTSTTAVLANLRATINGAQETPPNASPGGGSATLTYSEASGMLSWNIVFSGLSTTVTGAHFHGTALPGTPAGIVLDIGAISGLSSPMVGSAAVTPSQASQILAGFWYINIHTSAFPGGEIRGQVLVASASQSDFSGEGRGDVYWRDSAGGSNYQWQMNGLAVTGQGYLPNVPGNWAPAGIGDLNADGRADIFWRDAGTGLNYLWMLNGLAISAQGYMPTVPAPWTVAGIGDFDANGKADVLWRNPSTGQNYVWIMDGNALVGQSYAPAVNGTDWEVVAVGQFNGHGRASIFWRNKVTGQNYLWPMNSFVVASPGFLPTVNPVDWEVVGTPDADGDGRSDVLWRNKTSGMNYLWLMNGFTVLSQGYLPAVTDPNWKVVGFGDYDGDGMGDVLWRNATTGQDYLWTLDGISVKTQGFLPTVSGTNWRPVAR